MENKTVV